MEELARSVDVLVVDDDEADLVLMSRALGKLGVPRIDLARNGSEALAMLRALPNPVKQRLVLCDIRMPDMDGFQFLEEVRRDPKLKSLAVVMITSSREDRDRVAAYKLHAAGYVVKPLQKEEFETALQTVHDYWKRVELP